ncbi:response regulator [Mariprofundus sp. EBB-1]|uniref:ABC transporter substrate-binding protein n=1 Tax=Mariprofundus sp. EBB-1 TaxID=2650971 RepID=UPI000EF1AD24|nr:ABC transporter substrate-binding protein [Mariprofundus sp. EBB-1]RLL53725.1 response regulator [Mariprofundus sp. EBB-1]
MNYLRYACLFSFLCLFTAQLCQAANTDHDDVVRLQLKWNHQFQFAGYYAALEKGFYADEGLHVELLEGGPSHNPLEMMLAGEVQYAVGDGGALLSRAQGKPVVVLASIFQQSPLVIYTRSGVSSLDALRGKRVMMQSKFLTVEVHAMLQRAGLAETDYMALPIGSIDDFIEGRSDAFTGYSSNEGFLLKQRGVAFETFRPHDYGIEFYGDSLLTTEAELASHPERAAAFRRASIKGWAYALEHQQEIIRLIKQKYDSQHKSIDHLTYEANAVSALMFTELVPVGFSNLERWQNVPLVFESLGHPLMKIDWDAFIYQPDTSVGSLVWQYRYWFAFASLFLLVLFLYLFNVQLRQGIHKRTAALEQITHEYKDILDHMQDAYYRADNNGTVIWVSLACERQLGYQREEVIGQPMSKLYYDEGGRTQFLDALKLSGGHLQHFEVCLKHKDGSRVWVEVNSQCFFDKEGKIAGVEGNIRNIAERKKAEQESQELTGQLQQAQKMESIGVLAGGIAHDFNNMLVGVMGNAELAMLDKAAQGEMREYLEKIFKSARRGADLVKQMLAYSGQGRLTMGHQNFNDLICEVSELLSTVIGKKIVLNQTLMDALPDVYGDRNQLTQLVMNLMTNASESMEANPGEIHLRTGLRHLAALDFSNMYMASDLQPGMYVFVEVKDSGCGMDEDTKLRIFDPFFTTKETGSGLGLSALLGIVRSHGGTLALHSELGKGSRFTVFLPLLESEKPKPELQTMEMNLQPDVYGGVLLVDDEEAVRDVARRLLEREGIRVFTANDGEHAVHMFREHAHEISMVLMDLTMPIMDGEEAFHAIRAMNPDASIVLSSGFLDNDAIDRLKHNGLAGFMKKPYTRNALLSEVTRLGVSNIDVT